MTSNDRLILRDLAQRIAQIAAQPEQDAKRELWYAHNALEPTRPLIHCSPEGSWVELLPEEGLACKDETARGIEHSLRMRIYTAGHFRDDQVCDNRFVVPYAVTSTGWGVGPEYTTSSTERGSYVWEPPVKTHADLDKLQTPTATHDPEATQRNLAYYQDLFGDILDVQLHGGYWWALGLVDEWALLRGITQMYWDMADDPEFTHAAMRRLMQGKLAWLDQLENLGILSLNNGNDYVGSGGYGFSRELPAGDFAGTVRLKDMWGFCEAQTMCEVSPAMHEEFVLRYQLPILERFGLNYYGCCEPLHNKLPMLIDRVPNLRTVSISPWANKRISAERLGSRFIYGWKPNPASLAAIEFAPEAVRADIRETVQICREHGCILEMALKDTHTCNQQTWRFDKWCEVAMEEVQDGWE